DLAVVGDVDGLAIQLELQFLELAMHEQRRPLEPTSEKCERDATAGQREVSAHEPEVEDVVLQRLARRQTPQPLPVQTVTHENHPCPEALAVDANREAVAMAKLQPDGEKVGEPFRQSLLVLLPGDDDRRVGADA